MVCNSASLPISSNLVSLGFAFPNTHSNFLYAPFRLFPLFEWLVGLGIVTYI